MKSTYSTLLAAALAFASCNQSETVEAPSSREPSPLLASVLQTKPEGEAKAITTLRKTVQPGDSVTVSGRIMGSKHPFVEGRAAFVLGDPSLLTPCNEKDDDGCEDPWDTCCDSPEDRKRGTATIRVLGPDGRVLKEGIEGIGGLQKLSNLTISGVVAEGSSSELLVINAQAIAVEP